MLGGEDEALDDRERALAQWARRVSAEPNAIRAQDVQVLRDHGFDEQQILAITVYVAMRIAFATVNDALGSRPDGQLRDTVPAPVLDAVRYGRPIATDPSA
jgi:alkylhydroperoxidase family enzyme